MNELTTINNIKKAFSLAMGEKYSLDYVEEEKEFRLFQQGKTKILLKFEYSPTLSKFDGYLFVDPKIKEQVDTLFTKCDDFSNCQSISDAFFNHPISKIIFKDPVCFDNKSLENYKMAAKRITMSSNFSYDNAWNMVSLEQSYVITEDFKIKPIIDMSFNIRDFGFVRFLVDEINNECLFVFNSIDNYKGVLPYLNARTHLSFDADSKMKTIKIKRNQKNEDIEHFINMFIETMTPKLYQFFLTKFNIVQECDYLGTVDDFKVLEMLKV